MEIQLEPGDESFIQLSTYSGWPDVIRVDGYCKCMICEGQSFQYPICHECKDAVKVMRVADNARRLLDLLTEVPDDATGSLRRLLALLRHPGFLEVFERITEEQYGQYLLSRIDPHEPG